jgi:hypothetical protein
LKAGECKRVVLGRADTKYEIEVITCDSVRFFGTAGDTEHKGGKSSRVQTPRCLTGSYVASIIHLKFSTPETF